MKKLSPKTKKILNISVIVTLLIILVCAVIVLVKEVSSKRISKQVISMEEDDNEKVLEENNDEINIDELEEVTEEEKEEAEVIKNEKNISSTNKGVTKSDKKYYIKVNYSANVVTVYTQDDSGEYTIPVKAMICSTGTATPKSGVYGIKGRWEWLGLFGGVYGHYSTQIVGNILFHSVPYLEKYNPASLEYWEYDKLRNICISRMCKTYS